MMTYAVFILSIIFVIGFVSLTTTMIFHVIGHGLSPCRNI